MSRARYCAQQVITRHSLNHRDFDRLRDAVQHCRDQNWPSWGVVRMADDSRPYGNDGLRSVARVSDAWARQYLEGVCRAINERLRT